MLLELGLPSFNTLIHNCKISFADIVPVCDNAVVRCVLPFKQWSAGCVVVRFHPSLSVCLSVCFVLLCRLSLWTLLSETNKWMNTLQRLYKRLTYLNCVFTLAGRTKTNTNSRPLSAVCSVVPVDCRFCRKSLMFLCSYCLAIFAIFVTVFLQKIVCCPTGLTV